MTRLPLTLISILLSHSSMSDKILKDCVPLKEAVGCYVQDSRRMYIDSHLNRWYRLMAFYHESGHYLLEGTSYDKYKEIYGEGDYVSLEERGARDFNKWVIGYKFPKLETDYFRKIIR